MQELHLEHLHYDRICRTARSESYLISQGEEPLARIELHFMQEFVYGLLAVERDLSMELTAEEIDLLRDRIDTDLVVTADSGREDFFLTVFQGRDLGTYHDPDWEDEDAPEDDNGSAQR